MRGTDDLARHLAAVLRAQPERIANNRPLTLGVALSGGVDSTALLLGLTRIAEPLGLRLLALHVDHRLDPGSGTRAAAAAALAKELGVPFRLARLDPRAVRRHPGGLEAGARALRYAALEQLLDPSDLSDLSDLSDSLRLLATAHHADDQAETVALRLLLGSGVRGLAGIATRRGRLIRPLLALRRRQLESAVEEAGLTPVEDPTNRDPARLRNRLRHAVLPALTRRDPELPRRLVAVGDAARGADARLERLLARRLAPRVDPLDPLEAVLTGGRTAGGAAGGAVGVDRPALDALPDPLLPFALALMRRRAGAAYPIPATARAELVRQLEAGGAIGCDCGGGWRLEGDRANLRLVSRPPPIGDFSYTLEVPGRVEIGELASVVSIRRAAVAPWMFRRDPCHGAFAAALGAGTRVTVRNRRAGDRVRPLGGRGSRALKALLIDRRIPRHLRRRLPLLLIDDTIVWVPGVTIDHRFRITDQAHAWVASVGIFAPIHRLEPYTWEGGAQYVPPAIEHEVRDH